MPLTADANWYPLKTTSGIPPHSPPLLVQRSFTSNSYSVYLTDLTFLWGETLPRRGIIQRALNEDTSIDPSEDTTQLRILLEKLKESLSVCEDKDDNIDVHIEAGPTNSLQMPCTTAIHLKITYELPEPLKPLVWTFRFEPLPQTLFSKMLLVPLMSITALRSAQVQSLVRIIKDKDIVLDKLQESLKDQNIPVANIIGGSASRRRALERFDEQIWRSQILDSKASGCSEAGKILQDIFGVEGRPSRKSAIDPEWENVVRNLEGNGSNSDRGKDWWEELGAAPSSRERKKKNLKAFESDDNEPESPLRRASDEIVRERKDGKPGKMKCVTPRSGDDEFEVPKPSTQRSKSTRIKSTPPFPSSRMILESKQKIFPPGEVEDSSTEDDDGLGSEPIRTACGSSATQGTGTSAPTHRQAKSPISSLSLPSPRDLPLSTDSTSPSCKQGKPLKLISSPVDISPCIPPSPSPTTLNRHGTDIGGSRGRMGTIGGKKVVHRESLSLQPPCPDSPPPPEQKLGHHILASAPVGKIGKVSNKIGGRIGKDKNDELGDSEERQCSQTRNKTDPPTLVDLKSDTRKESYLKRESPVDAMDEKAADKKRKELQQELEAKQRTQMKKRRKF